MNVNVVKLVLVGLFTLSIIVRKILRVVVTFLYAYLLILLSLATQLPTTCLDCCLG